MKKRQLILAAAAVSVVLTACSNSENGGQAESRKGNEEAVQTETEAGTDTGSAGEEPVLVVYTARSEALNNAVIPEFEKDTGIKVEVVVAGTGELLKRAESEKDNPMGDIFWVADETMLSSSKELFMEYVSPEDENMEEQFRNKTGYFTPAFADPTVMIVNTDLKGDMTIDGFADLLNPELKGKIAFGDPVNSSSAFQSLMAMLYGMGKDGDPMSDKAWEFIDQFIANLDGKYANGGSQVPKSVAEGEYVVGLTWEDPVVNYIRNGAPVELIFPEEGAIFPGESVQIIKGCKHEENAKKFVDYMLSEEAQSWVGQNLNARPLREGVVLGDYMVPTEDIVISPYYDEAWAAENKSTITEMFTEHRENSIE